MFRFASVLVLGIFSAQAWAAPQPAGVNSGWFKCSDHSDCILSMDVCGGPRAINRKAKKAYEAYLKTERPRTNCSLFTEASPSQIVAICRKGVCSMSLNSPE